jgi:hypothetical protein
MNDEKEKILMKIKITKGSGWYENKVGEIYEVIEPYWTDEYISEDIGLRVLNIEYCKVFVKHGDYEILPEIDVGELKHEVELLKKQLIELQNKKNLLGKLGHTT